MHNLKKKIKKLYISKYLNKNLAIRHNHKLLFLLFYIIFIRKLAKVEVRIENC